VGKKIDVYRQVSRMAIRVGLNYISSRSLIGEFIDIVQLADFPPAVVHLWRPPQRHDIVKKEDGGMM
jgi:hypothetical protein